MAQVVQDSKAAFTDETASPRVIYEQRLAARKATLQEASRRESWFGIARVAAFGLSLFVAWLVFGERGISPYWLLPPVLAFALMVYGYRRVVAAMRRAERAVRYYQQALARLEDRWPGVGPAGERHLRSDHPYAGDLDLFGRGSLFQLLSTARTRMGDDRLADWLLAPASAARIRQRQAAVEELRGELDLRESLALLDERLQKGLVPADLETWIAGPSRLSDRARPAVAVVFGILGLATFSGWAWFSFPLGPFLLVLVMEAIFMQTLGGMPKKLSDELDHAIPELELLAQVLRTIEGRSFHCEPLRQLVASLSVEGHLPSQQIDRLIGLSNHLENTRRNQFVAPIAFVLMLTVPIVYAIERWRIQIGGRIPKWLAAVGEFEALSGLAGYAFEHPHDVFPEIVDVGPVFEAVQLGHPLIPAAKCVRNDVELGGRRQLLLVSGSNMSGKSTLLRAIGANVVLALAGGVVRAERLRISPLAIGSAMRTHDSLQEGTSHFYAELKRLRTICDLVEGPLPLLFMLDEILHTTNSHDRRIGAEAVIRKLLARGAIGLVTTHDLALAEFAQHLGEQAANVYFADQLVDDKMHFDYLMRPGIVPKSNALALMRLLGLEV